MKRSQIDINIALKSGLKEIASLNTSLTNEGRIWIQKWLDITPSISRTKHPMNLNNCRSNKNYLDMVTKCDTQIPIKWWRSLEHTTQNSTDIHWERRMNLGFKSDWILRHRRHGRNIPWISMIRPIKHQLRFCQKTGYCDLNLHIWRKLFIIGWSIVNLDIIIIPLWDRTIQ